MSPFTEEGRHRLQWGEQQVKASKAYLKKMSIVVATVYNEANLLYLILRR